MYDQPVSGKPRIRAIITYKPAAMKKIVPTMPSNRHNRIGNFENEKMASVPKMKSRLRFIFVFPIFRSSRKYSIKSCLNPINDRSPGIYLTFSRIVRRAFRCNPVHHGEIAGILNILNAGQIS